MDSFFFFPLKPATSFFFFLFYSLYSAGKYTLSPFYFFFRTVSLLLHEPVYHGFISLYSLSLMNYVVAEIQVPSHYQIHLFFLPPKEWEIICVIWETGICIYFFYTKNKYRGCSKNKDNRIRQVQIWMFDQSIRFHRNKTSTQAKINSKIKRSVLLSISICFTRSHLNLLMENLSYTVCFLPIIGDHKQVILFWPEKNNLESPCRTNFSYVTAAWTIKSL